MEIAIGASLPAKRNMYVDACQLRLGLSITL